MGSESGHFVQQLESRCLLSAALADGVLRVEGTQRSDTIEVALTRLRNGRPGLRVAVNDRVSFFDLGPVTKLRIIAGRGNDDVRVKDSSTSDGGKFNPITDTPYAREAPSMPTTIYGAAGDDTLYGGYGDDVLNGDANNDLVSGSIGHDLLTGGAGDDTVLGGEGRDTINGGSGDDVVAGENTRIDLMPKLYVTPPPERRLSSKRDVITGGSGRDTFNTWDDPSEFRDATKRDNWVEADYVY